MTASRSTLPPRFSVGLTGGIGCGKTTVADRFAALGAAVIDTDLIAHALTAPDGVAIPAIRDAFGAEFITANGAMDRARMRQHVFSDPMAKERLESILHPLIRIETERAAASMPGTYLLFVVPLLVESGSWQDRVERVLVIDCPEPIQIQRVMQRNGFSESQVRAIMEAQASRQTRLAAADDIIDNQHGVEDLLPQIDRLHEQYCVLAKKYQLNPVQDL